MDKKSQRLLVRSGGGAPGIDIHAGMWLALARRGIHGDVLSGTSAGAVISAFDATGWCASRCLPTLTALADADFKDEHWMWAAREIFKKLFGISTTRKARATLARLLGDLPQIKDLALWAVQSDNFDLVNLTQDSLRPTVSLVEAVLASMAFPGYFEPVNIAGVEYIDGGTRFNVPLPADWCDYGEVWVLMACDRVPKYQRKGGVLTAAIHGLHAMMVDEPLDVVAMIEATPNKPPTYILWPDFPTPGGTFRFDHDLIIQAEKWTYGELDKLFSAGAPPSALRLAAPGGCAARPALSALVKPINGEAQ